MLVLSRYLASHSLAFFQLLCHPEMSSDKSVLFTDILLIKKLQGIRPSAGDCGKLLRRAPFANKSS